MGKDCGGGARHPRGGMAELLRSNGSAGDAPPTVPRQPQAGDLWKRATPQVRCQSGSSGSAGSGKRSGRRRCRVPWTTWALGRNFRCPFPPLRSWHRQARIRGQVALFSLSFLCCFLCKFPWGASTLSWDRPGRRAKGLATSRHRADSGQEADSI